MNSVTSANESVRTPSRSRRLNVTFVKSQVRNKFPCKQDQIYVQRSNKLKSIEITEHIWKTYKVNSLYNFSYRRQKLMEYQIIFAKYMKKAILETASDLYKSEDFIIHIETFSEIAFTEKDSPAVKISITTEDDESTTEHFVALLLSIERKEGFMEKERLEARAVILPLLLVDYEDKIFLDCFVNFLEENFCSAVFPLKFSSYDLKWMLALFSSETGKRNKFVSSTVLEYRTHFEELSSIDYVLHPTSISKAWKKIINPAAKEINEDEVDKFISTFEDEFQKLCGIKLSLLDLCVIKTPLARVEGDHSIIASDTSKLYFVMRHLTHLAQELV